MLVYYYYPILTLFRSTFNSGEIVGTVNIIDWDVRENAADAAKYLYTRNLFVSKYLMEDTEFTQASTSSPYTRVTANA